MLITTLAQGWLGWVGGGRSWPCPPLNPSWRKKVPPAAQKKTMHFSRPDGGRGNKQDDYAVQPLVPAGQPANHGRCLPQSQQRLIVGHRSWGHVGAARARIFVAAAPSIGVLEQKGGRATAEVHNDSLFPFPAWADDSHPVVFDQTALVGIRLPHLSQLVTLFSEMR